jgi:hypothetical protein
MYAFTETLYFIISLTRVLNMLCSTCRPIFYYLLTYVSSDNIFWYFIILQLQTFLCFSGILMHHLLPELLLRCANCLLQVYFHEIPDEVIQNLVFSFISYVTYFGFRFLLFLFISCNYNSDYFWQSYQNYIYLQIRPNFLMWL